MNNLADFLANGVTPDKAERTLSEQCEALLESVCSEIMERCKMEGGYLIPRHDSNHLRLLNLLVKIAKEIEG